MLFFVLWAYMESTWCKTDQNPLRNLSNQTQRGWPSCSRSLARFSTPEAKRKVGTLLVTADEEMLLLLAV